MSGELSYTVLDRLSRSTRLAPLWRAVRVAYAGVRRLAERLGLHVLYATYDSPIPRLAELPAGLFGEPSALRGVDFAPDRQLAFVEDELAPYLREFRPPLEPDGAGRYFVHNGTYESVDADLLYAFVRRLKPSRIVELGSGYTTLVMREACAANAREGKAPELRSFDPYPSDVLAEGAAAVEPLRAQDVPAGVFDTLGEGDILFVDTSHTVKLGGDVNAIVLDVLPQLRPGVVVHFHDIFLPWHYSRKHLEDAHFWAEQYLLQAFLSGNPDWQVLVGAQALARLHPERVAALVPTFGPGVSPGAFWIRRKPS